MRGSIKLLLAAVVIGLAVLIGWRWSDGWAPDRAHYRVQGFVADPDASPLPWPVLKGRADFVYLLATTGVRASTEQFLRTAGRAEAAGLAVGAIHRFTVCLPGREQATNLLAHLPRDARDLPLAVELTADGCPEPPTLDQLVPQLATFLQVAEAGQPAPAILKLSPALAERYPIAERLDRPLWLTRAWWEPASGWEMWEANAARRVPGVERPLAWSVARPQGD